MSAALSPKHYDKFTYAVKRRPEASPEQRQSSAARDASSSQRPAASAAREPTAALLVNRDGFAVAEDGALMSRVVSPPPSCGVACWRAPVVGTGGPRSGASAPLGRSASAMVLPVSAGVAGEAGWPRLVHAVGGDISEEELAMLQWDTLYGLLLHFGLAAPLDVARVQLVWKKKQLALLEGRSVADVAPVVSAELEGGGDHGTISRGASCLATAVPPSLEPAPIQKIAYGRPSSPREKGRFVPPHKQPLNWSAGPKVDTGRKQ